MSEIQSLTLRVRDLSQAVDFWNVVMLWGLAIAALAAIIIGISTRLVVVRTGQLGDAQDQLISAKDRQLQADLKEKDRQIAVAGQDAALANERAGKAEENAAKAQENLAGANERAAEANAKAESFRLDIAKANASAANANLELVKLKTPRSLSPEQQRRVASALARFPKTNFAFLAFGDPESLALLGDIDGALQQAGWNRVAAPPNFGSDIGFNTPRGMVSQINDVGLKAYFPADVPEMESTVRAIAAAISSEGVPCEPHFSDRMKGYTPRMILISVGQKRL